MKIKSQNRILVTGSSGFIGTHLVKALLNQGNDVYGTDIQLPINSENKFCFMKCDIVNTYELKQVLFSCQPHIVIHLAARTDLDGKTIAEYSANVAGVRNLLEAVAITPSVRRCIYTSSQLVCKVGYVPNDDQEYCPNTKYGESKVLTEQITKQLDGGGREWCLVRPTTVWGVGMRPHYQRFFKLIRQGHYFHIGNRPLYKSYSYVGNIVYQYIKLLEVPSELINRKTLYLADYQPISLHDWANAIQRELEAKKIYIIPESIARIVAIMGDVLNAFGIKAFPVNSFRLNNILTEYQFDLSVTKKICGELPYTIEQGIKEIVPWIRTLA